MTLSPDLGLCFGFWCDCGSLTSSFARWSSSLRVIEERFGFDRDEGEITAEVFERVGSLLTYVAGYRN
jgi:hypothetical protein